MRYTVELAVHYRVYKRLLKNFLHKENLSEMKYSEKQLVAIVFSNSTTYLFVNYLHLRKTQYV